jgi:hypothetical protein
MQRFFALESAPTSAGSVVGASRFRRTAVSGISSGFGSRGRFFNSPFFAKASSASWTSVPSNRPKHDQISPGVNEDPERKRATFAVVVQDVDIV